MKYTKKFQQGGYLAYVPTPLNPPTLPTYNPGTSAGVPGNSSAQQAGGFDWLDKDLKKELLKGGLTNDVNALYSQLAQIGNSPNAFLDPNNRQMIYAVGAQINELQRNKEMWANSYGIAEKAGGLSEVAVGNSGEIYVKDAEGIIRGVSVEDYKKRPQLYTALSVAELLEKRNTDRQLTNNNEVFNVANNAIGMNNIINHIDKIVKALGTESQKESNIYDRDGLSGAFNEIGREVQMTGRSLSDAEQKGFRILNAIRNSPSKYNEVMSSESSERNHAEKAIKYIWTTLGDNAQRKLSAQAALNNTSVEEIITSAVLQGTNYSTMLDVKPISEAQAKSGGSGGSDVKGPPMSPIELFMTGTLYTGNHITYNDPDVNAKLQGTMTGTMAMVSPDNKTITPTTMSSFLMTGWETLVDSTQIQFGNKKVKTSELKDIILDGHSNIARAYLPVDINGDVDNATLDLFSELMRKYNNNKDKMTKKEVDELFRFNGFNVTVNDDKSLDVTAQGDRVKPFLITHGYTKEGSNLVKDNTDVEKGGLWELDKERSKDMKTFENSAWSAGKDDSKGSLGPRQGFFGRITGTDRYKGIIYMPIREGASVIASAEQGHGPKQPQFTREDVMHYAQNTTPSFNSQNSIYNLEK